MFQITCVIVSFSLCGVKNSDCIIVICFAHIILWKWMRNFGYREGERIKKACCRSRVKQRWIRRTRRKQALKCKRRCRCHHLLVSFEMYILFAIHFHLLKCINCFCWKNSPWNKSTVLSWLWNVTCFGDEGTMLTLPTYGGCYTSPLYPEFDRLPTRWCVHIFGGKGPRWERPGAVVFRCTSSLWYGREVAVLRKFRRKLFYVSSFIKKSCQTQQHVTSPISIMLVYVTACCVVVQLLDFMFTGVRWVPDSDCGQCTACGAPFTLVRRRHHCRNCGRIFCSRCSSNSLPLPELGYERKVCYL